MKGFQYQICTSVKRSGKQLPSETKFCAFLQISCTTFKLKLCHGPQSYKNYQANKIWRILGRVSNKNCFLTQSFRKYLRQTVISKPCPNFRYFISVLVRKNDVTYCGSKYIFLKSADLPTCENEKNRLGHKVIQVILEVSRDLF